MDYGNFNPRAVRGVASGDSGPGSTYGNSTQRAPLAPLPPAAEPELALTARPHLSLSEYRRELAGAVEDCQSCGGIGERACGERCIDCGGAGRVYVSAVLQRLADASIVAPPPLCITSGQDARIDSWISLAGGTGEPGARARCYCGARLILQAGPGNRAMVPGHRPPEDRAARGREDRRAMARLAGGAR